MAGRSSGDEGRPFAGNLSEEMGIHNARFTRAVNASPPRLTPHYAGMVPTDEATVVGVDRDPELLGHALGPTGRADALSLPFTFVLGLVVVG